MLSAASNKIRRRPVLPARTGSCFLSVGFHGDEFLLGIVDSLAQGTEYFFETGTNVGSTLAYVARKYPQLECFSCEIDPRAYILAKSNTTGLENVQLFNETSQSFLRRFIKRDRILKSTPLFWLDAHGHGFEWPLNGEMKLITHNFLSAYILIDDFYVPGRPYFGYDSYMGQVCSLEFIQPSLNPMHSYVVYYPTYSEHTSSVHPLRGWVLITYGIDDGLAIAKHFADITEHSVLRIDS
jgi:hypothetical protein